MTPHEDPRLGEVCDRALMGIRLQRRKEILKIVGGGGRDSVS